MWQGTLFEPRPVFRMAHLLFQALGWDKKPYTSMEKDTWRSLPRHQSAPIHTQYQHGSELIQRLDGVSPLVIGLIPTTPQMMLMAPTLDICFYRSPLRQGRILK